MVTALRPALSLFFAVAILFGLPVESRADTSRYSAFVVDESTGVVLHSRRSDAERYPASLTKMMTLYMLFDALESGEIGLQDPIRVSQNAANAVPSRLGLSAGDTITVENAIRALVIKSANDVAVAVGERIGGGESRFAELMTEQARELGMAGTTFRNASGLPDRRQVTTARDMARLAVALHRDFPDYFHYFNEERFTYNGRTYRNHNSLVGRVEGVDGLKTGYIRASGFNVVVSAERGDHRLITVVMGGPSAASRDAHAEELIEAAFGTLEQREDMRLFAALTSPRISPMRQQEMIAIDVAALHLAEPTEVGSAQSAPPVRIVLADEDEMARPEERRAVAQAPEQSRQPAPSVSEPSLIRGAWSVQVGAYNTADQARAQLDRVEVLSLALNASQPAARSVDTQAGRLWRARFEALTETEARQACADLSARSEACFAVAPGR
jgi:D-alanyl-D-alanine carboxypeptidase